MLMNMKDILAVAKEHRFAIPAFNISDWSMFLGIMDLCEETNSPVIIEIHPDELSFTGPDMVVGIRERAMKSPVPVCIHLDHCGDFGKIIILFFYDKTRQGNQTIIPCRVFLTDLFHCKSGNVLIHP